MKKKNLYALSALMLLVATLMMCFAKFVLFHTQAGPDSPRIAHYYTYLDPMVYFGGGMYFAPLAVILAAIALVCLVVSILKNNRGGVSFGFALASLVSVIIVTASLSLTIGNIIIALFTLASVCIIYFASHKVEG